MLVFCLGNQLVEDRLRRPAWQLLVLPFQVAKVVGLVVRSRGDVGESFVTVSYVSVCPLFGHFHASDCLALEISEQLLRSCVQEILCIITRKRQCMIFLASDERTLQKTGTNSDTLAGTKLICSHSFMCRTQQSTILDTTKGRVEGTCHSPHILLSYTSA
jgi:hypothetical protein